MKKFHLGLILFLINFYQTINAVSRANFFPYGILNGDEKMPKGDDLDYGPINIPVNFLFFKKIKTSIFLNTNGAITLDIRDSSPPNYIPIENIACISAFWADADTQKGGDIYYRAITDSQSLASLSTELRNIIPFYSSFSAIWAFVATYIDISSYYVDVLINNTFQVLIFTDGQISFAIFNYENLAWTSLNAIAGFNEGDGLKYFALPGSHYLDLNLNSVKNLELNVNGQLVNLPSLISISELANTSNVNIKGKWAFRIDSDQIIEASSLTTTSTTSITTSMRSTSTEDNILFILICAGIGVILIIIAVVIIIIVIVFLKKEMLVKTKVQHFRIN